MLSSIFTIIWTHEVNFLRVVNMIIDLYKGFALRNSSSPKYLPSKLLCTNQFQNKLL